MRSSVILLLIAGSGSLGMMHASDSPQAEIGNSQLKVRLHLPDKKAGFYRGTRFDWSGVIYSLEYAGHNYYGPWFDQTRPTVHDFIYEDNHVVAGPCSAITGPVDEFGPLGWDEAKPGGTFVKIGVGVLRKPVALAADAAYDHYSLFEVVDDGHWVSTRHADSIDFAQNVVDQSSGYGYRYRKLIRLTRDRPQMILEHHLQNTGKRAIHTSVYNHNFLVLDHQPPSPDFLISVPFQVRSAQPPDPKLAEIRGNQIVYLNTLTGQDTVATPVEGFGASADDHEIRIDNRRLGAGMRLKTDRPLSNAGLWSIRTVLSMEPFVAIDIEPGAEFSWTTTYDYYKLDGSSH